MMTCISRTYLIVSHPEQLCLLDEGFLQVKLSTLEQQLERFVVLEGQITLI